MAKIDENYFMKKGESADAYNTRVENYRASKNTTTAPAPEATTQEDPFLAEIQKRIVKASEAVSSSESELEKAMRNAIGGLEKSTQLETERLKSEYGRELGYAQDKAKLDFQGFSESRSGFATNMVAFRNLVETTDKDLKDLEQRKQEAILANNSQGAAKIAELELKAIEYRENKKQQVFDNLLNMGSFGLNVAAERRAGREFAASFKLDTERVRMERERLDRETEATKGEIALQYGIELREGDTLSDVINRAKPRADQEARLRLEKLQAERDAEISDLNSKKGRVELRARIADLMASGVEENGQVRTLTASEAVMQATAELEAVGWSFDSEDFNEAVKVSEEIAEELKSRTSQATTEIAPSFWDRLFREAGNVYRGYEEEAVKRREEHVLDPLLDKWGEMVFGPN